MEEKLLRVRDVARILNVNYVHVWNLTKQGIIPAYENGTTPGGRIKKGYLMADVVAFDAKRNAKKCLPRILRKRNKVESIIKRIGDLENQLEKITREV